MSQAKITFSKVLDVGLDIVVFATIGLFCEPCAPYKAFAEL